MNTEVIRVDSANPELGAIRAAAAVIRGGGLVAFPTETVYGLGANALEAAAVGRIFGAKGRPATNPVIVHVAGVAPALNVVADWPATAAKLAARFWPGPLTLVVPRGPAVPDVVTASGPTVAVRCPAHSVAAALIREAGVPIAAPSANRSTGLSPTRAEHVLTGLSGRIDMVLDGGPCPGGIESTVVDVAGGTVQVLRPGLITVPMLEEVCGTVLASRECEPRESIARSPGQMTRHYSPRTPIVLAEDADETHGQLQAAGLRVVSVGCEVRHDHRFISDVPEEYAAHLYAILHELDGEGYDRIVIELPPDEPAWTAVRDRLMRAAASDPGERPA